MELDDTNRLQIITTQNAIRIIFGCRCRSYSSVWEQNHKRVTREWKALFQNNNKYRRASAISLRIVRCMRTKQLLHCICVRCVWTITSSCYQINSNDERQKQRNHFKFVPSKYQFGRCWVWWRRRSIITCFNIIIIMKCLNLLFQPQDNLVISDLYFIRFVVARACSLHATPHHIQSVHMAIDVTITARAVHLMRERQKEWKRTKWSTDLR